jgi:hypothetical protein
MHRTIAAATLLLIALAGCTPATPEPSAPPATESASPTSTPEPTEAAALVIGVDEITLVDQTGGSSTAPLSSASAVVGIVTEALQQQPSQQDSEFTVLYTWADGVTVTAVKESDYGTVRFNVAEANGYVLRTSEGISVGSPRSALDGLTVYDEGYDGDGDGLTDILGLEPREEPGTTSLAHPGEVGTSYVAAIIVSGTTVTALVSPAGDWRDV